jgi:putative tricarboxylic transport membrane protein
MSPARCTSRDVLTASAPVGWPRRIRPRVARREPRGILPCADSPCAAAIRRTAPRALRALLLLLFLPVAACEPPETARGWECIAPANAGGGWDLTCRTLARALGELGLAPGMVRVSNMPGAGGGIAYAHAVSQRHGDGNVLVAASPATVLRLAQGQFAHLTEDEVRWVGAVATDYGMLAVQPGAPWTNLEALLEQWRRDPASIVVSGGSAVGGQDHMKILLLADRAGIDPRRVRYVPFDGGGEALTALLGGFVNVFSGDVTGGQAQMEAGNIRVLAVLAAERMDGPLAAVPTARELGYPVEWVTWRGFYAPGGLADDAYAGWVGVLDELAHSDAWATVRRQARLDAYFLAGEPFEAFVREQITEFRMLSRQLGLIP